LGCALHRDCARGFCGDDQTCAVGEGEGDGEGGEGEGDGEGGEGAGEGEGEGEGGLPGIQCNLEPANTLAVGVPGLQGLAWAEPGRLFATSIEGGPNWMYELDPQTGDQIARFLSPSGLGVGLAFNDAHLYVDEEGGAQALFQVDIEQPEDDVSFVSPATGDNGGLTFLNGSLWQVAVFGGLGDGVRIAQIDFAGGRVRTSFLVPNDVGTAPRELASDGVNLLYVSRAPNDDPDCGMLCLGDLMLLVFRPDGTEHCRQQLPLVGLGVSGLASDGTRLYVGQKFVELIFVFDAAR
jgi:hypothetical protein